jgi:hypothetical protein
VDSMDLDEGLKRDREGRKDGQERSRIVWIEWTNVKFFTGIWSADLGSYLGRNEKERNGNTEINWEKS